VTTGNRPTGYETEGLSLGGTGAIPGAALIFVSARLKLALNAIWELLLCFSEEALFPDFNCVALWLPCVHLSIVGWTVLA
jgi:hypothetical protein